MRRSLLLAALAASTMIAPAMVGRGLANDRYGASPPLVVSPDLAAPWVMQLQRGPQAQGRTVKNVGAVGLSREPARLAERRQALGYPAQTAPQPQMQRRDMIRTAAVVQPQRRAIVPEINPIYLPQQVAYDGPEKPGTILIDTQENFLYLIQKDGQARRYGVGTGKPGFEWAGTHKITAKKEWPDWRPPAEMIVRERAKGRILPVHMQGGPENPLGARAMYLGSTLYRIHGTNQPWTIGGAVSSGCIRMRNEDVVDLYERVSVGTKVIVR